MLAKPLAFALLPLLLLVQSSFAAEDPFDPDQQQIEEKTWETLAGQLPSAPLPENLLPLRMGRTATLTFSVDAKSLSVDEDGVVRYTLVAVSPTGTRNVSYEGIRCSSFEKRQYAFGQENGEWRPARNSQWEHISRNIVNHHHAILAQDYFCDVKRIAGDAKRILRRIRYDEPVNPRTDLQY